MVTRSIFTAQTPRKCIEFNNLLHRPHVFDKKTLITCSFTSDEWRWHWNWCGKSSAKSSRACLSNTFFFSVFVCFFESVLLWFWNPFVFVQVWRSVCYFLSVFLSSVCRSFIWCVEAKIPNLITGSKFYIILWFQNLSAWFIVNLVIHLIAL